MWSLLNELITVRRATAYVLDRTSAASTMSWSRQPPRDSVIEFRVWNDGTSGTGTITVAGTSSGLLTTETVVASGPGYYRTTRRYTGLVGLTTSGLDNEASVPTLEAQAAGADGSRQETHYTVVSGWPAAIMLGGNSGAMIAGGAWPNNQFAGRFQNADAIGIIARDETWAPREGDLIDDSVGRTWQVVGHPQVAGTIANRHWHLRLRHYEVTA